MKLSFIPAGDETTASSRIRVFSLQPGLVAKGVHARIGLWHDADALFVQKRVDASTLGAARQFAGLGRTVFYDCDDLGPALHEYWAPEPAFREMLQIAHVVTTNTTGYRDALRALHHARTVEVIPDTIDYYPNGMPAPIPLSGESLRVLWFGNVGNLWLLERCADALRNVQDIHMVVCTDASARDRVSLPVPYTFVPWSVETFTQTLRACHLSLLSHAGRQADRLKSNNRMITSIGWGVPAVVSRTPEYATLAEKLGVARCVFDDARSLCEAIGALRSPDARVRYLRRAMPLVWRDHCLSAVTKRFVDVVSPYVRSAERSEADAQSIGAVLSFADTAA